MINQEIASIFYEIADILGERRRRRASAVKSVDNALSRIKNKAKDIINKIDEDLL